MIEVAITKEIVDYVEEHKNRDKYDVIYQKEFEVKEGEVWYLEGISQVDGNVKLQKKTGEGFWLPMYFVTQETVGKLLEETEERRMHCEFQDGIKDVNWMAYRIETARQIAIASLNYSFNKETLPDYGKMMEWSVSMTDKLIKELRIFKKEEKKSNHEEFASRIPSKRNPLKFKPGHWYTCIKDYYSGEINIHVFHKGQTYQADNDGSIYTYTFRGEASEYFRDATEEEIAKGRMPI